MISVYFIILRLGFLLFDESSIEGLFRAIYIIVCVGELIILLYFTFTGDKGSKGRDGAKGPDGDKGQYGYHGDKGRDGNQGDKGSQGYIGEKGLIFIFAKVLSCLLIEL